MRFSEQNGQRCTTDVTDATDATDATTSTKQLQMHGAQGAWRAKKKGLAATYSPASLQYHRRESA